MKTTVMPIVNCALENTLRTGKGTGRHGNKRSSRHQSDNSIIKIDRDTEKSPGDLKGFAVTQTLVRNHQLTLMSKP